MSRGLGLLFGAVLVALVAGHLLRDTRGYAVRAEDGTYEGDLVHYVYWTRLVTLGGIQAAYGGEWPETYAVYPPVTLYPLQAVGNVYRLVQDPAFDPERAQDSLFLRAAIKFVALAWHLLTGLALYLLLGRTQRGAAAAALYVADPALLYDVAHWGQPDGAHSLFSVLAVGWLGLGYPAAAWAAMALAALAKPQAWSIGPLLALGTVRERGPRGLVVGLASGAVVSAVVILPFALSGTLAQLLSLPGTIASVMPVVSADAHNLWWLASEARGVDPLFTPDSTRLVGPITYRVAAAALVLAQFALTWWLYWTRRVGLAEAAALGALGWFVCTTQAHENHLFFALPLLALAWPARPSLLIVFGVLSATLLANMVLHDQLVLEALGRELDDPLVAVLRSLNAAVNVLCFVGWSLVRITGQYDPRGNPTPAEQEPRARSAGRRPQLQRAP